MRIKIEGKSDLERVVNALKRMEELQPEGITWSGVNIYLTLKDEDGNAVDLANKEGEEMNMLVFKDPKKKTMKAKEKKPALAQVIPFKEKM
jgi:hypothetical protein